MPREFVSPIKETKGTVISEWLDIYYIPSNYSSSRVAILIKKDNKKNGDIIYEFKEFQDDYKISQLQNYNKTKGIQYNAVLLSSPNNFNIKTQCIKQDGDMWYYGGLLVHNKHNWDITMDSDYSRINNLGFQATMNSNMFESCVEIIICIIRTHNYFCSHVPELVDLTIKIRETPKLSDTMQKYIACLFTINDTDFEYQDEDLYTMWLTAIQRGLKYKESDLKRKTALAILLPLIKIMNNEDDEPRVIAKNIHKKYISIVSNINLDVSIEEKKVYNVTDNWNLVKQNNKITTDSTIDSITNWNNSVCMLGRHFGISEKKLVSLKSFLSNPNKGPLIFEFKLRSDKIDWITNMRQDYNNSLMRIIKNNNGSHEQVRIIGININTTCWFTLNCNSNELYTINIDVFNGCNISVSSENNTKDRHILNVITSTNVNVNTFTVRFNAMKNTCIINQDNTEFEIPSRRLNIKFTGCIMIITKSKVKLNTLTHTQSTQSMCCICLNDFKQSEKKHITKCNHKFHIKCIDPWITKCIDNYSTVTCPLCRQDI